MTEKLKSESALGETKKVKVIYDYTYLPNHDNKNLVFKTGEEYYLLNKATDNWWYVKRNLKDPVGVYIPRLYVTELTDTKQNKSITRVMSDTSKLKVPLSPKAKNNKDSALTKPALSQGALDELNDIINEIGAPEHFKDDVQTSPPANDVFISENLLRNSDVPTVSCPLNTPPSDAEKSNRLSGSKLKASSEDVDSDKNVVVMSTSFIGNCHSEEDARVDSETSDYKTDSRESLRSDGQLLLDTEDVDEDVKSPSTTSKDKDILSTINEDPSTNKVNNNNKPDDYKPPLKKTSSSSPSSPSSPQSNSLVPPPSTASSTNNNTSGNDKDYANYANYNEAKKAWEWETPTPTNQSKFKKPFNSSQSTQDYANLEEIQKVIHNLPCPPLAEHLLPAGYVKTHDKALLDVGNMKITNQDGKHEPTTKLGLDTKTLSTTSSIDEQQQSPFDKPFKKTLEPKLVEKKGILNRAKVEESSISKKIKKSWSQSFVVLQHDVLLFYKDTKASSILNKKSSLSSLGKPDFEIPLKGVKVTSAPEDKNVKKDAFMLITTTKTHYLLHHDEADVNLHWRQSIENNVNVLETVSDISTLPMPNKDKPAHKSFDRLTSFDLENKQTIANRLKNFLLRRPSKESIKLKGIYKEVIFGSSIQSICEREKSKIPRFVRECILAVENRGLSIDGIYRVSGNMANIQKLRNMVDMNEYYDLSDPSWDIHTITGALKLFFRELSEPLFTCSLFEDFIKALHNVNQLKELIKKLPATNAKTLKALFRHLDVVLQHSKDNRMQSQGLAIVFGPTLLWSDKKVSDANMAFDVVQRGQLVEFIINNCRSIFG